MDFIGIGPLEVVLVLILGFLFWGPDKLPQIASQLGKWYRKFTQATFSLTRTISEEIAAEKKEVNEELSTLSNTIKSDLSVLTETENNDKPQLDQEHPNKND